MTKILYFSWLAALAAFSVAPTLAAPNAMDVIRGSARSGGAKAMDYKDYTYEERENSDKAKWAKIQGRVTECDRLTANENDPRRTASPVQFKDIDARRAVHACQQALAKDPTNGRLMTNLGRAFNRLEDYPRSFAWTQKAVAAGHPAALTVMALHHLYGEGTPKNAAREIESHRKAREKGMAISALRLAELALEDHERSGYQPREVAKLLRESPEGRTSSKVWGDYYYFQAIRFFYGRFENGRVRFPPLMNRDYKTAQLPEGRDVSTALGPALLTEFRNLLRSARDHYVDAQLKAERATVGRRIQAIEQTLKELKDRYARR